MSSAALVALLVVTLAVAWAAGAVVTRRRRALARVRPHEWLAPGAQAGTFVPLATAGAAPVVEEAPEDRVVYLRPVAGAATTYEIVWYRVEDRIVFALQPLDGRTALVRPARSATFAWPEDRDPPHTMRAAQREHARLRERLLRDGWTRAGRGERWFSHRFRPPEA